MPSWYEFEEIVGRIWHGWAAKAVSYPSYPEAGVLLDPLKNTLQVYFHAIGGDQGMDIQVASEASSRHRLSLRQRLGLATEPMVFARRDEEHLILPPRIEWFADAGLNRDAYFWLSAFLAQARPIAACPDPLQRDLHALAEAYRVSHTLCERYPGLALRYRRLCRALLEIRPLRRLPPAESGLEALIRHALGDGATLDASAAELLAALETFARSTELQAPPGYRPPLPVPLWGQAILRTPEGSRPTDPSGPGEEPAADASGGLRAAERRALDQPERDDPLLLNPFEKLLSFAEMINVNRHVEDDEVDDARKAAQQLEQLTLSEHHKETSTRLQMDLDLPAGELDDGAVTGPHLYPEWNFRKRRYLDDYCAVFPESVPDAVGNWHPDATTRRRIQRVRRQFEALRPRRVLLHAQADGDELDLDALVRSRSDLRAGGPGSERVYNIRRDQSRDLAVSILVDVSLSTESWLDDRTVLNVEQEALLVLAHGIHACGDEQAIHSFTSHRRHRVEVAQVKGFDEALDERIERRILALKPRLYTRMGAAIRHVAGELAERPNRFRLLLLITDGKPNDTDHYEGRFAVEDTRMAVHEARMKGLSVFGVTVDAQARQYFPRIFGRGGFAIVPRARSLVRALPAIYRQITGQNEN